MASANPTSRSTSAEVADIAARLERLDPFLLCARATAAADNTSDSNAVAAVLLYVQNDLYDLRCAIASSLSGDGDNASAGDAA